VFVCAWQWLRIRSPLPEGVVGQGQAVDVEWKVNPARKGQKWEVSVFLEPPGGGIGQRVDVQAGGSGEMIGYAASPAGIPT